MFRWIRSVFKAARWTRFVQMVRRVLGLPLPTRPADAAPAATPATFSALEFEFAHRSYPYRLYIPTGAGAGNALPLVVLLHGCKQNAADFALGTAMNAHAETRQCLVLYPEQLARANPLRCWNWFDTAHQVRDQGEPALIAALTRHVLGTHRADPARVYIAGLSAGGAMAAVVAGLYPDLFTGVGVHSGLPRGAATDVISAFAAMRRGSSGGAHHAPDGAVMPTIVFHGSADQTVHPANGEQVTDAALAALSYAGLELEKTQHSDDTRVSEVCRNNKWTFYASLDDLHALISRIQKWHVTVFFYLLF